LTELAAKLTAGTSAARDQAKVRLLSAAVTELAKRIALKASGIFTCARLHAAGTD
jgi:hypothetical protein